MRPQKQKYRHDPDNGLYGDCYRTCIATILDLDRDSVPHFAAPDADGLLPDGHDIVRCAREWLSQFDLGVAQWAWPGETSLVAILDTAANLNPGVPMILVGASSANAKIGHAVIVCDGKIVHSPNESTVVGPIDGYWWIESVCVLHGERVSKLFDLFD